MTDNEIIKTCSEVCGDNRFELIEKYQKRLIEATNIETSKDEMAVINSILFRCWQMGWLDMLEDYKRQQAEIDRLEIELTAMRNAANGYKAEAERLHPYKLHYGNLRMEIAREVCDRVKDIIPAIDDTYIESMVEEHINDLIKEMEKENGELD